MLFLLSAKVTEICAIYQQLFIQREWWSFSETLAVPIGNFTTWRGNQVWRLQRWCYSPQIQESASFVKYRYQVWHIANTYQERGKSGYNDLCVEVIKIVIIQVANFSKFLSIWKLYVLWQWMIKWNWAKSILLHPIWNRIIFQRIFQAALVSIRKLRVPWESI